MKPELLLPLVDALASGGWRSGERLAKRLGITRAALSKRMRGLEAWGLEVQTRTRLGYRLAEAIEPLDAARIRRGLSGLAADTLARLEILKLTDSTNARLLAVDSADDPQALLAEFQSAGRGRRAREWVSPYGANLMLSLAWTFPSWPPQITALSLAVGVACARALGLPALRLKWPNDLRVNNQKLGGILIEQRSEAGGACRVVIGLGLNVAMRAPQGRRIGQPWTSLRELGIESSRNALAAALISRWIEMLKIFGTQGFKPFAEEWARLDGLRDARVAVLDGARSTPGVARGVDADGALRLEHGGEIIRVLSGDVSLRRA